MSFSAVVTAVLADSSMMPSPAASMGGGTGGAMASTGASMMPSGGVSGSMMPSGAMTTDAGSGMMAMSGPDLLPPVVTWIWLVLLAFVLVFHCSHFLRMGGQHRWFHASHILMLVSMLYMYAGMEFSWKWLSHTLQMWVFILTSALILVWMILRIATKAPFSFLWILALIMQAAMAYMWMPDWIAVLTWILVGYYTLEALAWLFGLINDTKGRGAVGSGDRTNFVALAHPSILANVSMAIMAASMAYMFAAMQLMR